MSSKAKSQIIHAKRRAYERYDLKLSKKEYNDLVESVKQGKAKNLYSQTNRTSVKMLEHNGKDLYFVYDNKRHTIVTFLLKEYVDMQAAIDCTKEIEKAQKEAEFYNIKSWEEVMGQVKKL